MQLLTAGERDENRARGRAAREVHVGGESPPVQAEPVPRRIMHELRRRETGLIERADLAARPAPQSALSGVVYIDVTGRAGRLVGEGELLAGGVETEVVDAAILQARRLEFQVAQGVEDGQMALAIVIHGVRHVVTARAYRERLHIPGHVGGNSSRDLG